MCGFPICIIDNFFSGEKSKNGNITKLSCIKRFVYPRNMLTAVTLTFLRAFIFLSGTLSSPYSRKT